LESFIVDWRLSFDALSIFFGFVILLVAIPSWVYSIGYMQGLYSRGRIRFAKILFFFFILSMLLVVFSSNVLFFLIAWELMSLLSYFLVTLDSHEEKASRAGLIYILMTHVGTTFMTAAFLIIYSYSGSFDFIAFKETCLLLPSTIKTVVFLCFVVGFGTKAGLIPFHIWLPYAHPEAPSHISSVMSGAMIKIGVYGFIRFVLFILGVSELWWGNLILVLAIISSVGGILYALMEKDLKKMLAYSSIENIGLIMLGIGGYMVFIKMNQPLLAVFSLAAALYHTVNHAIFKTLLFMCSGAILKTCGTKNMEKLGGLIKLMPVTAFCFLIGALSISAMPPLNGFMSEWLILQTLFSGALAGATFPKMKIFLALLTGLLALTGGLAAACFVKAFGISFLAGTRSKKTETANDSGWTMKAPMIFLTGLIFIFGIFAAPVFKVLIDTVSSVSGLNSGGAAFTFNVMSLAPRNNSTMSLNSLLLFGILVITEVTIFAVVKIITKKRTVTCAHTWACGYYRTTERNQYTSTGFSKPFRVAFSFILMPSRKLEKIRDSHYHVKAFKYEVHTKQFLNEYFYKPVIKRLFRFAEWSRKLQQGSVHIYIGYIFLAIVFLIVFLKRF